MQREGNNFAFIDSQNVNLAIRSQGWSLDFERFRVYLKEGFGVTKAYLFIGYIPSNEKLYELLRSFGYILIFKPVVVFEKGRIKGNVDAELVLHAMVEYSNYDQAVIISGDGDFYCLVDYLHTQRKLRQLIIPNKKTYSRLLKPFFPNKIHFMSDLKAKLEYKKSR